MSGRKDSIRVFLRVRPDRHRRSFEQRFSVEHSFEQSIIQFHVDRRAEADVVNHAVEDYRFAFDRVFEPQASQEDVFNMVAKDSVLSALEGFNATIFAYGQTGSGKTYSITGGTESYADRGIIPRTLSLIYDEVAKRTEYEWTVRISYLQIYNDKGQDLLNRGKDARTLDDLPVVTVQDTDDEIVLRGLEAHTSSSVHEALNLLFLGDTNRLYCETPMNKTSSRSHCIFTISLEARGHGTATVRRSKLNLVDLAGSERVGKTGVTGNLLTEAKYINLSLHFLEHVIVSLADRKPHVPFRNSFMTMVLRDSLGGNCRTAMLATAYPTDDMFMESISTCRFAQRVAQIRQNATINEETDPVILVKKLKAEVAQLKEQIAFYTKGGQSDAERALSSDELQRCQEIVSKFIEDPDPKAQITGLGGDLARILACFSIMKVMVKAPGGTRLSAAQAAAAIGGSSGRIGTGTASGSSAPPPTSSHGTSSGMSSEEQQKLKAQVDALTVSLQQKENELSLLFNIVEKQSVPKFNAQTQTGETGGVTVSIGARQPAAPPSVSAASLIASSLQQQPQGSIRAPTTRTMPAELNEAQAQVASEFLQRQEELRERYDLSALTNADMLKDRAAAFECFRRSYRKFEELERSKADLKPRYERCKALADQVNGELVAIQKLKTRIQQLRAERALQGSSEPDDDEIRLKAELDAAKARYKPAAQELAKGKEEIDHMHLIMMRSQQQLAKDFEDWISLRQKQVLQAQKRGQAVGNEGDEQVTDSGIAGSSTPLSSIPSLPPIASSFLPPQGRVPAMPLSDTQPVVSSARVMTQPSSASGLVSSSIISQIQAAQAQRPAVSSAPGAATASTTGRLQGASGVLPLPSSLSVGAAAQPLSRQVGNFVAEEHSKSMTEHAIHNRMMDGLEPRNPFDPKYVSTGNAEADAQLAEMYKARQRLLGR